MEKYLALEPPKDGRGGTLDLNHLFDSLFAVILSFRVPEKITYRVVLVYNAIISGKAVNQSVKLFLQGVLDKGLIQPFHPCLFALPDVRPTPKLLPFFPFPHKGDFFGLLGRHL
ncbi:MAG: hypothetical protein WC659_02185 [Patescibacteria group bacterium]